MCLWECTLTCFGEFEKKMNTACSSFLFIFFKNGAEWGKNHFITVVFILLRILQLISSCKEQWLLLKIIELLVWQQRGGCGVIGGGNRRDRTDRVKIPTYRNSEFIHLKKKKEEEAIIGLEMGPLFDQVSCK